MARWGFVGFGAFLAVRALRAGRSDIEEAIEGLAGYGSPLLVGALLIEVAWVVVLAQVYRSSLIAFGGESTLRQALRVSMGAFSVSRVVPGGGAVGALFAAREFVRQGNRGPTTLIALVFAGWASLMTLTFTVSAGVVVGVLTGALGRSALIVPALVLVSLVGAGVLVTRALRNAGWRARVLGLIEKLFSRWAADMSVSDLEVALSSRPSNARGLGRVALWALLSWLLDASALWLVFAALGQSLDIVTLSVGYGLANLIQALPEVTPGWLGVIEGTLAVTYAALGVPLGVALLAVLGYRLLSFWMPVVAGIPFAMTALGGGDRRRWRSRL